MTILTQGVVLKRQDRGDFDRQFVIYTEDLGKIAAVAKGAKKVTSKLNSHLEPFLISCLMIAGGRTGKRLAAAQTLASCRNIRKNWAKIVIAQCFLETLDLLVDYEFRDQTVFALIREFLSSLDQGKSRKEDLILLNKFLFEILSRLGYCPVIRSRRQKGVALELNRLILEVGEKPVKSFAWLIELYD